MINSDDFKFNSNFKSKNLLLRVMDLILASYGEIKNTKKNVDTIIYHRENHYRNDLVKVMNDLKSLHGLSGLIINTEPQEIGDEIIGKIDIKVEYCPPTVRSFELKNYHSIECKRLDRKLDFSNCYYRGLNDFIEGKYSKNTDYAGMLYFIEEFPENHNIEKIVEKWNHYLENKKINIIKKFEHNYDYFYYSKHQRKNESGEINIFHLMLDYSEIYNLIN